MLGRVLRPRVIPVIYRSFTSSNSRSTPPGNASTREIPMGVVTVRKLIVLLVAVAVLAPVAASAGTGSASARSDWPKLRAAMGTTAFSQAYATFGACVSRYAPIEQQLISSAGVTCTAQQADPDFAATHGGKTFDQYYGNGKKDRNAFANCVSIVAKASRQAEQQGR